MVVAMYFRQRLHGLDLSARSDIFGCGRVLLRTRLRRRDLPRLDRERARAAGIDAVRA